MLDNTDAGKSKAELIAELQALRAERAQATRGDIYRKILDNIPLRLSLKDADGRYLYVNNKLIDVMGMPPSDFLGKTSREVYGDDRGDELNGLVAEVIRTGKAVKGPEVVGRVDTNLIYRRDLVPIKDDAGDSEYLLTVSVDMSDRRRAEERLLGAVETLSGPFSLWDAEERLVLCNENFRALNEPIADFCQPGVTAAAFFGAAIAKNMISGIEGEEAAWLEARLQRFRNPGNATEILRSNGVWLLVHEHRLKDGSTVSVGTDVTALKRAEQAVLTQKSLLQSLIDNVPVRISLKDADGRYLLANKSLADAIGKEPEYFVGKTVQDVYGEDNGRDFQSQIEAVLKFGEAPLGVEIQSYTKPGETLLRGIVPVKDATGKIQYIVTTALDVTKRRRAERALQAQKALLQTVVDNLPVKISLRDADGRYVLANKGLSESIGRTPEGFIGKRTSEIYPGPHGEAFDNRVRRVLETGEASLGHDITGYNNPKQKFLQSIVPIKNNAGDIKHLLTMALDVTALKNAEAELARHRDHLAELVDERTAELQVTQGELVRSERLAAIGKLTATISHELRNPLGTIRSSFFTVKSRLPNTDEKLDRALDRIERNITRCVDFIEDMLDYTRLRESMPVRTDIDAWCRSLTDELEPPDGVLLQTDCQSGVKTTIDPERMRQVLVNLLQNAWQALENRHGDSDKMIVTLSTATHLNRLVMRIADNGPGVPEDVRDQIFEPLFSTKVYGVGLGLPLVRQIIEEHGGDIRLEPFKTGAGAVFTITLPLESLGPLEGVGT